MVTQRKNGMFVATLTTVALILAACSSSGDDTRSGESVITMPPVVSVWTRRGPRYHTFTVLGGTRPRRLVHDHDEPLGWLRG